jgi:hypothetical protein
VTFNDWPFLGNAVEFTVVVALLLTSHTDLGIEEIMCAMSLCL